jgi:hypothetical protein
LKQACQLDVIFAGNLGARVIVDSGWCSAIISALDVRSSRNKLESSKENKERMGAPEHVEPRTSLSTKGGPANFKVYSCRLL